MLLYVSTNAYTKCMCCGIGRVKNVVVSLQIISQKDEHCWIGELNGLRGWFPAKFVELLDERSKNYSSAGDDTVTETVTDLVRGV